MNRTFLPTFLSFPIQPIMDSSKLHPLLLPPPPPPLPPPHPHHPQIIQHNQNYVVLPSYYNNSHHLSWWAPPCRSKIICIPCLLILLLLLASTLYAFWPSDPDLKIMRLKLRHVRIHTRPHISVDVSLDATVRVHNKDLYWIRYTALDVAVGYRGKVLGHVTSGGGHVRPRGCSIVNAMVEFNGVKVMSDWIHLVDDFAKGFICFDTLTQVDGFLGFFFFQVPLKAKISCEIDVNTKNQTLTHQNCYPE